MFKKLGLLVLAMSLLLTLGACGVVVCKESGCNDEVYQDGYCKYHYTINAVDSAAKDVFDGFNGLFG